MKQHGLLTLALMALGASPLGAQGRITGTVYDSLSVRGPLRNATVVLAAPLRYATTDERGRFTFSDVPEGRYLVSILHPVLDSLDLLLPPVPVVVPRSGRVTVALATPSPETVYASFCPRVHDGETGAIFGRVLDVDDGMPLADAAVGTAWTEFTLSAGRRAGRRVGTSARTNAAGLFVLCEVPTEVPLDLRASLGGQIAGPARVSVDRRLVHRTDLALSRKDPSARSVASSDTTDATAGPPGTATLLGVVRGANGRAARNASIVVLGTTRATRTDSGGAFRIDGVPAGTRTLEVRSIGVEPVAVTLDLRTRAILDTSLALGELAQSLAAVKVQTAARSGAMSERQAFELRRTRGLGNFLTEDAIAKLTLPDLAATLALFPGVHIEYGTSGSPTPMLHATRGGTCVPNFYLDGAPFTVDAMHPFADLSAMVRPDNIRGMELYKNPGLIPAQFDMTSSTGCGSIVIWTK